MYTKLSSISNAINTKVDFTKINRRIEELECDIDECPLTVEASQAANDHVTKVFADHAQIAGYTDEEKAAFNKALEDMALVGWIEELAKLNATLDRADELIYCPMKYLITDGPVVCPSGFHMSDRVYVANTVNIHSDSLNLRSVPHTDKELRAYRLDQWDHLKPAK